MLNIEHPSVSEKHALQLALKSINDTMGRNRLVHSLLVSRVLPSFTSLS